MEIANRRVNWPAGTNLTVVGRATEDGADQEFARKWADTGMWGTPLYFADALDRWPQLHGAALTAIAHANGPILMHCGRGHDRTGIMALILLALADATVEGITEDYLPPTVWTAVRSGTASPATRSPCSRSDPGRG